jgi:hypothetical protein
MTHTPGPWTHEVHQLSEGFSGIVYAANGMRVGTDHLSEDDARLIAASPDLLEACKALVRFVDSHGSEHINRVPFAAARAAIAKAEGKP